MQLLAKRIVDAIAPPCPLRREPMPKQFILFDGRAKSGDTDDAAVLDTAEDEIEAREVGRSIHGNTDATWFEYDCLDGKNCTNPVPRWDIPPASKTVGGKPRKAGA